MCQFKRMKNVIALPPKMDFILIKEFNVGVIVKGVSWHEDLPNSELWAMLPTCQDLIWHPGDIQEVLGANRTLKADAAWSPGWGII